MNRFLFVRDVDLDPEKSWQRMLSTHCLGERSGQEEFAFLANSLIASGALAQRRATPVFGVVKCLCVGNTERANGAFESAHMAGPQMRS